MNTGEAQRARVVVLALAGAVATAVVLARFEIGAETGAPAVATHPRAAIETATVERSIAVPNRGDYIESVGHFVPWHDTPKAPSFDNGLDYRRGMLAGRTVETPNGRESLGGVRYDALP